MATSWAPSKHLCDFSDTGKQNLHEHGVLDMIWNLEVVYADQKRGDA
jgi:hypothetical protein